MLLKSTLSRFAASEGGNVAMMFGCFLMMLTLCVGAGVDISRQYLARRVTADAIDAAVLAGGRHLQDQPSDVSGALAAAAAYYEANKSKIIVDDSVEFKSEDNDRSITAKGSANIETYFIKIAGFAKLAVVSDAASALAKAALRVGGNGGSDLEIAIMMDVTGSMCDDGIGPCKSGTKIKALKDATSHLIDMVISTDQSQHTSRAALIPFSTRVRVAPDGQGDAIMKQLTNLDPLNSAWYVTCPNATGSGGSEGGGNWQCNGVVPVQMANLKVMPCVTERYYQAGDVVDATDNAPGPGRWLNAHGGNRWPLSQDSASTPITSGLGAAKTDPTDNWNYDDAGDCSDVWPENEVLPLTSDKSALTARINGLNAYGATAGTLGTAWSWYMLSPNWNTIWTGASAPGSYFDVTALQASGAPKLRKVAVLMTDGGYDAVHGWKDQDQVMVSNTAVSVCNAMKAKGIEIYTVGFELNQLPVTQQPTALATLKACGTDLEHFYQTLNPTDLDKAFTEIGNKLSSLRLTH